MASAEGSSFESAVAKALKDCPPGTVCLAAVSGGADSVAMLVALAGIKEWGMGNGDRGMGIGGQGAAFDLRCIHVEHGIRPEAESRGDADFVRGLCERLCVPCRVVAIPPGKIVAMAKRRGLGIEAAARLYRRRAFFREAARLDEARLDAAGIEAASSAPARVLTAHTADDALETTLMRILRGAGPSGLAAMPASRGRLLRPLLALSRRDVLGYLAEKNISWREDSTNTDTAFLRNRIRHRLIPLLNETFPQWHGALASLAETQSRVADFLEHEARQRVTWEWGMGSGEWGVGNGEWGSGTEGEARCPFPVPGCLFTDSENFFAQPAIVREEALFQGIDMLLAAMPSASDLSSTVRRLNIRRFSEGSINAADLGPLHLRRDSQKITISTAAILPAPHSPFPIPHSSSLIPHSSDPHSPFPTPHSPFPIPHSSECSFSLLIKAPGLYNLKDIAIDVRGGLVLPESAVDAPVDDGAFLALLPLVLRPRLKEDRVLFRGDKKSRTAGRRFLAAVDCLGPAAFIGENGLARRRDDAAALGAVAEAGNLCMVKISMNRGSMNV